MGRILIVDDDLAIRSNISLALRRQGHETLMAEETTEAFRLARHHIPDLIISDVCMRGGDGFDFLKKIRADSRAGAIPFILMTGHPDEAGMVKGFENAADGYLAKPFSIESLRTAVESRLKRQELTRRNASEMEAQLHRVLEGSPDLTAIVDSDSLRLLFVNSAGARMLESVDDLQRPLTSYFSPAAADGFEHEAIPAALKCGHWRGESLLVTPSGREIPVEIVLQAHRHQDGAVQYLSVIARDLTERRRVERERQELELQLRQAQKLESIGQLAAGIAHEINTPTQYIGDNVRFLKDAFAGISKLFTLYPGLANPGAGAPASPSQIQEIAETIEKLDVPYFLREIPAALDQSIEGIERVSKIVHAMKDFSHPNSTEKCHIDINQAIESTLTVARNEWKYVATLETDFAKNLPNVPCFPGEFNQVILNLVVNAAHAIGDVVSADSEKKGTIRVSTAIIGKEVEIRISDTGTGIPEKVRTRIFEPFFTTKEVGKGTGQGLALARSVIVDKHGGTLTFETQTGKGTTFIIRLPL